MAFTIFMVPYTFIIGCNTYLVSGNLKCSNLTYSKGIFQCIHVKRSGKSLSTRCTINIEYIAEYATQYDSTFLYPT